MFQVPLYRFCIAFFATTWCALYFGSWCVFAVPFCAFVRKRPNITFGLVVGLCVVASHDLMRNEYHLEKPDAVEMSFTVRTMRTTDAEHCQYQIEVDKVDEEPTEHLANLSAGCVLRPDDRVKGYARRKPYSPKEFPDLISSNERNRRRGVSYHARLVDYEALSRPDFSLKRLFAERRISIEKRLTSSGAHPIHVAMLTGQRANIDDRDRDAYRAFGLSHLIAISGLHFGVLAVWIWAVVGWCVALSASALKRFTKKRFSAIAVLVTMASFLAFIGAPASGLRAFGMLSIYIVSSVIWRKISPLTAYAVAGVGIVFINPFWLWDIGFQFSFAAVGSILVVIHNRSRPDESRVAQFAKISGAASFGTWPVSLAHFGQVSLAGPLLNLIVVPIFSAVIFPVVIVSLGLILFDLSRPLGEFVVGGLSVVFGSVSEFGLVRPVSFWSWTPGVIPSALAALMLFGGWFLTSRVFQRWVPITGVVLAVLGVMICSPASTDRLKVSFIPVGQGDATLVSFRSGEHLLVDAGGAKYGADPGAKNVVPFLSRRGITEVKLLITHDDIDHAGGANAVKRNLTTAPFEKHEQIARFRFPDAESKNDGSEVLQIRTGDVCVLLTGDIEKRGEVWLAEHDVCATVLKVPHHGSRTSSSESFLDRLNVQFAVVSAGRFSRFGHPHLDVVARYARRQIPFLETANHGLIEVETDGRTIEIVGTR